MLPSSCHASKAQKDTARIDAALNRLQARVVMQCRNASLHGTASRRTSAAQDIRGREQLLELECVERAVQCS